MDFTFFLRNELRYCSYLFFSILKLLTKIKMTEPGKLCPDGRFVEFLTNFGFLKHRIIPELNKYLSSPNLSKPPATGVITCLLYFS